MDKKFDGKIILKAFLLLFLVGVIIVVDMITKSYFDGKTIVVIEGVFSFTSSHNTGAAFSFLSDSPQVLMVISIIFLLILIVIGIVNISNSSKLFCIGYTMVLGGAIGNFFDRIVLGYVRDFVSLDIINFAIFNFADTCITIGVVFIAIYLLFIQKD